ncbi:MAG TPA: MarR family transcriptional regulator [Methanomicrobia archaeon]|nr:MarR family transcriptional regulator [Methanomicrobia archaeon]
MDNFEAILGHTAHIVVLAYLIRNRDRVCYLSGIAEDTGLSHSSVARVITPLLQKGLIKENHIGKKMRTLNLNENCELVKLLISFFDDFDECLADNSAPCEAQR